jgi:hypothetical protein
VSIIGLKKFTKIVRSIARLIIPIKMKMQFLKFFRGFLVVIKPIIKSIDGMIITGPISIILLITILVVDIFYRIKFKIFLDIL